MLIGKLLETKNITLALCSSPTINKTVQENIVLNGVAGQLEEVMLLTKGKYSNMRKISCSNELRKLI